MLIVTSAAARGNGDPHPIQQLHRDGLGVFGFLPFHTEGLGKALTFTVSGVVYGDNRDERTVVQYWVSDQGVNAGVFDRGHVIVAVSHTTQ